MLAAPDAGRRQRGARRGRAATGLARVPAVAGDRDPAGEHHDLLDPAGRSGRRPGTGGAARPVPHRAAAPRAGGGTAGPQLLAVRGARRRPVPDQRQARGARRGQRVPPLPAASSARSSRSRRPGAPSRSPPVPRRYCWSAAVSAPPRCSRCCTRWPPSTRPGRCGGCRRPATERSGRSPRSPPPCSRAYRPAAPRCA